MESLIDTMYEHEQVMLPHETIQAYALSIVRNTFKASTYKLRKATSKAIKHTP